MKITDWFKREPNIMFDFLVKRKMYYAESNPNRNEFVVFSDKGSDYQIFWPRTSKVEFYNKKKFHKKYPAISIVPENKIISYMYQSTSRVKTVYRGWLEEIYTSWLRKTDRSDVPFVELTDGLYYAERNPKRDEFIVSKVEGNYYTIYWMDSGESEKYKKSIFHKRYPNASKVNMKMIDGNESIS